MRSLFSIALGLLLAGPVAAQPSVRLGVADLELATPAGAQATLARIDQAARTVCRARARQRAQDFDGLVRVRTCQRDVVARSVAKLDAPLVTAAWRGGRPLTRLAGSPR